MPRHNHTVYPSDGNTNDYLGGSDKPFGLNADGKNTSTGWSDFTSLMSYEGESKPHSHGNTEDTSFIPPYYVVNTWIRIN